MQFQAHKKPTNLTPHPASSVTAQVAIQLSKRCGLKVVAVADQSKHGSRLEALGAGKLALKYILACATNDWQTRS